MEQHLKLYIMRTEELENPAVFAEKCKELSEYRRRKIDAVGPEQEKRLSLAAGLALDAGLRAYGQREKEMRIEEGPHGKPYFPEAPGIHFSLAHSGTLALAAFSDAEIGCDIQEMKTQPNARRLKMAERFFCPEETAWMTAPGFGPEGMIRFYRLWVLKESYVKMTGEGLTRPFDSFCFSMEAPDLGQPQLQIAEYSFGGCRAAVCRELAFSREAG